MPALKKAIFSLLITAAFFFLLELLLLGIGVDPIIYDEDPYVGFSSYIPLFVERHTAGGAVEMVTATNKLNAFNAQWFSKEKPPATYRIFCVGGSTTHGRPYDDTTSFCGWLRELLRAADKTRQWEVINAGGVSYASYRVAMLMEELVRYQPDLFIIYSGHNEFLERRTYASIIQMPSTIRGIGGVLSRTRTFNAVRQLVHRKSGDASDSTRQPDELPGEADAVLDRGVGPAAYRRDDELQQQILAHYRFNLVRMVDIAHSANADAILVVPASNLSNCSPFKSQHRDDLGQADQHRWEQLFNRAIEAQEANHPDEALMALNEAASIDERYAHLHYLRGQVLDRLERPGEAKRAYLRARDEDVCPLRALSSMQTIVEDVASQRQVPQIDFVQLSEQRSKDGIPGQELFLDHVHPTIEGNRWLALSLLGEMVSQGTVQPAASWGDQDIQQVIRQVESMVDRKAHGGALRNLAKVLAWAGKLQEANQLAIQAVDLIPNDANAHYLAGNALIEQGDLDRAVEHFQKALSIDPNYVEVHNSLGIASERLGIPQDAVAHYKRAIQIRPDFTQSHGNLGVLLSTMGKTNEAASHYEKVLEINPHDTKARNNLGLVFLKRGEFDQARVQFEQVLRINPEFAESHYNLGRMFAKQGHHERAMKKFKESLRCKPDYDLAHEALGLERLRQGNFREAVPHLRRALELTPQRVKAAGALAWILATCNDPALRDGEEAVRLARFCVQKTSETNPDMLAILAAAYAETGRFDQAIQWQSQALATAPPESKDNFRRQLRRYQTSKPMRQGSAN